MISCWLVDYCPQRFSFRYIFRSPMCYFHLCFFFLICTDAMHWIRVVISMVLFCCFRFSFTQRLTCILTCWMVHGIFDDLMLGLLDLCSVCQVFSIRLYTVICSAIRIGWQLSSIDWLTDRSIRRCLIDWLIDRSIDWLIHWLAGCWLRGYSGSFLRSHLLVFIFPVPCAHGRCDPWEFLLVLRGFVELISVMVRFRTRCYFVPPGDDWRTTHLEP